MLQLTEKIQDIVCHIFIANFFNFPALQAQLLQRKIFSAGTVTFKFYYKIRRCSSGLIFSRQSALNIV